MPISQEVRDAMTQRGASKLTKLQLNPEFLQALAHFAVAAGDSGFFENPHVFVTMNENCFQKAWSLEEVLCLAHDVLSEEPLARLKIAHIAKVMGPEYVENILAVPVKA